MKPFIIGFIATQTLIFGLFVPHTVKSLHEATVRQCYLHDWPADKTETHLKFCQDYLARN